MKNVYKLSLAIGILAMSLNSFSQTITLGTGTITNGSTSYPAPYGNWYYGAKHQFLVTKAELDAALANIALINSVGFDVVAIEGTPLQNFEIKIGHTTVNDLTSWQTGLTTVFGPVTYTESVGWNIHNFSNPFSWNCTDNVVIEVCFQNTSFTNNAIVNQSSTTNVSSLYYREDAGGVCPNNSITNNPNQRPNIRMDVSLLVPVDVAMMSIDSIFNGEKCGLTNAETVYAAARFTGVDSLLPGDTVHFHYQLNSQSIVNEFEVLVDTLWKGDTILHTFAQTADASLPGAYTLTVWTTQTLDTVPVNDTLVTTFTHIPTITSYPYLQNFESGANGWSIGQGSSNSSWAFGTPNKNTIQGAASGDSCWVTGGLGFAEYNNNEDSWILSPCFDFTNVDSTHKIALKIWYDSEDDYDGTVLQSTIDSGISWQNVGAFNDPFNWYNSTFIDGFPGGQPEGWHDFSNMWLQAKNEFDTTLFGQSEVRFRVAFGSDGSVTYDGFAFDDFAIGVPTPGTIVENDDTTCAGVPYVLNANLPYGSYSWSTGDNTQSTSVSDTGTHVVVLTYFDTLGFCSFDTVTIVLLEPTPTAILGPDTTHCGPYILDGNNFYVSHNWNTGETSSTITVPEDTSGLFIVTTEDVGGNCFIDSVNVTTLPVPVPELGPDFEICDGGQASLNAGNGFVTYSWSSGGNSQNEVVNPPDGDTTTYYVTVTNPEGCEGVDSVTVISKDCSSINELANGASVSIFPNPAKETVNISLNGLREEFSLSITNAHGQTVFEQLVGNGSNYKADINVAGFVPGVYFVNIQTQNGNTAQRFVVQH